MCVETIYATYGKTKCYLADEARDDIGLYLAVYFGFYAFLF